MIECPYPSELLSSLPDLSKLLFLKRNLANDSAGASQPGSDESFYAPQTETGIAILRALEQRYCYLNWKNIADKRHVLTEEQRAELVKYFRDQWVETPLQQEKIASDWQTWSSLNEKYRQSKDQKGKGASRGRGAAQLEGPKNPGSWKSYLHAKMRSRWCRYLQINFGTKQFWELMVFSGRFDPKVWEELQDSSEKQVAGRSAGDDEEARRQEQVSQQKLKHAKAVAHGNWVEGERLDRKREYHRNWTQEWKRYFNSRELQVLEQYDSGDLHTKRNDAIRANGHGQLRNWDGSIMDIGGSTGGASRRVLANWDHPHYDALRNCDANEGNSDSVAEELHEGNSQPVAKEVHEGNIQSVAEGVNNASFAI